MPRVTWSAQAEAELEDLVPASVVRNQIRKHAEAALRCVTACTAHEGAEDGIMWRRAITREQEHRMKAGWLAEADGGEARAWDYFLLYRLTPAGFEVLAVRSIRQIAGWELMYRIFRRVAGQVARSA